MRKQHQLLINPSCCCCGAECPPMKQWWNRDNGYSICKRCIQKELDSGTSKECLQENYGKPGIHYEAP